MRNWELEIGGVSYTRPDGDIAERNHANLQLQALGGGITSDHMTPVSSPASYSINIATDHRGDTTVTLKTRAVFDAGLPKGRVPLLSVMAIIDGKGAAAIRRMVF